jgi:hypothetical protein
LALQRNKEMYETRKEAMQERKHERKENDVEEVR